MLFHPHRRRKKRKKKKKRKKNVIINGCLNIIIFPTFLFHLHILFKKLKKKKKKATILSFYMDANTLYIKKAQSLHMLVV
jgi:hypothetical protein